MTVRTILLAGIASLALAGCGEKQDAGPQTPASAAAATAGSGSPIDSAFRLRDAEPVDIDALFALMPADERPSYDSASFDSALGATVVTGLRFGAGGADALLVERAEFYGVDLDALDRVKNGETAVDAPFETVFEKVRLFNVAPAGEDAGPRARIGAAEIDKLRIRRGGPGEDSPARAFNAFELAGVYFKDIAVEEFENEGTEVALSAPDLRFVGIGGGKLGAVIAHDLSVDVTQGPAARAALEQSPAAMLLSGPLRGFIAPESQRSTMKTFEWRGIDLSGLLAYGLKNEKPPLDATNLINLGSLKATDMETFIGGRRAAVAAETTVSAMEFAWLIPSKIRAETKGAEYDFTAYIPAEEEAAAAVLKKHGLDKVKAVSDLRWDWDPKKGDAAFLTDFKATGLADFALSFDLAGLDLEKANAAMEAGDPAALMSQGAFKGFRLAIADKKLLDAAFDVAALEGGQSAADLRASSVAMARLSGAGAAAFNPRIMGYVNAVATFLEQGGSLEVKAAPAAPVPFATIDRTGQSNPETLPDLLNLEVTHKK